MKELTNGVSIPGVSTPSFPLYNQCPNASVVGVHIKRESQIYLQGDHPHAAGEQTLGDEQRPGAQAHRMD